MYEFNLYSQETDYNALEWCNAEALPLSASDAVWLTERSDDKIDVFV